MYENILLVSGTQDVDFVELDFIRLILVVSLGKNVRQRVCCFRDILLALDLEFEAHFELGCSFYVCRLWSYTEG